MCVQPGRFKAPLFLLLLVVAACGDRPPPQEAVPVGIAWFQGEVQDAFAQARTDGRPVFLYWGAAWCPYCQQLKSSVFTRRDFIEKSRFFVPVYLDGDDPGAQKWGERLRVSGYPTVVILQPDGTELMRVAGGMDVERYTEILDLALVNGRPVQEVFALLETGAALSVEDCRRIAWHGFALDENWSLDEARTGELLSRAAAQCPDTAQVERARLQVLAATASIAADGEAIDGGAPASPVTASHVADVVHLLGNTDLAVTVADALIMLNERFFTVARHAQMASDDALQERWFRVMDAAAVDSRYSESDQLFALYARLEGAKVFAPLPVETAQAAHERVQAALARQRNPAARASVVNASLYVLNALGKRDELYAVAEREIEAATAPYYYMSTLASIDERRGRPDAALAWLERAYSESQGPATRFQWGTSYVAGLIRMRPDDEARIREAALAVLGELDGPDRLHQRTTARIKRLENALRQWNATGSYPETFAALRARMQEICREVPAEESRAKITCEDFLS